jgi:heme A synthase
MQSFLVEAHRTLANMVAIYALLTGIWGVMSYLRRQPPDGNYNGALAIGVGLFLIEGLIGIILVLTGLQPARGLHFLYGVTIMITIPGIFAITRGSNTVRESMLYGIGMIFIWGLAQRAAETAATL